MHNLFLVYFLLRTDMLSVRTRKLVELVKQVDGVMF